MSDAGVLRQATLEIMGEATKADAWDVPPVLVMLLRARSDGEIMWAELPGFDLILARLEGQLREVPTVAAEVVRRAAADGYPVVPADAEVDLVGIMLCHEGWGFMRPADDAQAAEMAEWARTKSIADHPLGVETRNITVVGADGFYLSAVQVRGEAEPVLMASDDGSGAHATGYVMDGLRDLHAAITETM